MRTSILSDLWDSSKNGNFPIYGLQNIAKSINQKGYNEWINTHNPKLYGCLFASALIADYFKYLYGDIFINVNEVLYFYNGIYWERDDKKHSYLINFFDKTFYIDLLTYANKKIGYYTGKISGATDDELEKIKDIIKSIQIFLSEVCTLRSKKYRNDVISDIITFTTNNKIEFNTNNYLFAFKNKIFDLKNNKFIEPKPEYFITQTAGYDYMESSKEDKDYLNTVIDSIFPNPEVKDDYSMILATGLCGVQMENCFVANGSGRNGKGVINSLMMKTTGEYGYILPATMLMKEIKSGGADPQIANMNNKRFVVASEPEKGKKIMCSTLKTLTGEKLLNARDLYSSNCDVHLKLSLVLECNELPLLDEVNPAVVMRIRTSVFEQTFYTLEELKYLDEETKKNIKLSNPYYKTDEFQDKYKCVLFDYLLPYFMKFKDNKYRLNPMPLLCAIKCRDYLAVSDDIFSWFNEFYEKTETIEESEAILLTDIYELFKNSEYFMNMTKADKRKYNRKYFIEQIEKNIFLRTFLKNKNSRHNGQTINSDSLVGWRLIPDKPE